MVEDGNRQSCGLDTEVWISQDSTISDSNILALEALLQTKSEKDLPDMQSNGVESIYWAGTESGLMDIYNFHGVIYATDGSKGIGVFRSQCFLLLLLRIIFNKHPEIQQKKEKGSTGMGAGFHRHDIKGGGCCHGGAGGGSSSRAKFAAACLALEDSFTHDQPIVVLTDSKELMTASSNWVGEGKDPLLRHSPDENILARIIKVLHKRESLGLFTMSQV